MGLLDNGLDESRSDTHLLVDTKSDDPISSAAISINSKMYSPLAPVPDSEVTTCRIQSGHFVGRPGTSLSASDVI